jgi:hypothetical protein
MRAAFATHLLGANVAEQLFYPNVRVDAESRPLTGTNKYVLRFEKDKRLARYCPPPERFRFAVRLADASRMRTRSSRERRSRAHLRRRMAAGQATIDSK